MDSYPFTKALITFVLFVGGIYVAMKVGVFVVIYQLQVPALILAAGIVLVITIQMDRQAKEESSTEETQQE